MGKTQLIDLFQAHVGVTPVKYVTNVRLQRAKTLLHQCEMSVTAIGFEAGFGSLASFERAFKQQYGKSPNEYRRTFQ